MCSPLLHYLALNSICILYESVFIRLHGFMHRRRRAVDCAMGALILFVMIFNDAVLLPSIIRTFVSPQATDIGRFGIGASIWFALGAACILLNHLISTRR